MLQFLTKMFDENAKTLKSYAPVVAKINALEDSFKKLTDEQLRAKTTAFRSRVKKGESLESILPEAFAAVREASARTVGLRHYDVQLMAGMAFHDGRIAEQRTGEGKTLSATLALYLNSLAQKGTHLVTVNDYLAQLGAGWMGPIFHLLDTSIGVIIHDQAFLFDPDHKGEERGDDRLEHFLPVPRKEAYAADITYGTNNEFGFDYLRDNMVQRAEDMVQREHYFAIVDEADSILIDEARTPLIISAPDAEPTQKYYEFSRMIETLEKHTDYEMDEKLKTAHLTDLGIKRIERKLGITNLYEEQFETIHHVEQALKAKTLFHRDKEYIVRDNQVIIVDEHTGRLMHGRRYSDGLHQAIEAKENVQIQQESRTLATISLQNYFRLYAKLSGMSGTATTETEEFQKIYHIGVLTIPTHLPVRRKDMPDVIYKTTRAKYGAIVQEVAEIIKTKQPILIGTRSIEHNEIIAQFLSRKGIAHNVLNAKNNEKEAFIISDAGRSGAVTVATNIAGRGVDIVLGGTKPEHKDFPNKTAYNKALKDWEKRHAEVVAAGGLYVIGSERHESRRIDNQLRGRSGRQGDPGMSKFFVSLEDEIMRLFGGEQISKVMTFLKLEEDQPIEHGMINKAIEQAQIKVEGFFFDQRKRLVEFDDVMNKQREVIYSRRKNILLGNKELKQDIMDNIDTAISAQVSMRAPDQFTDQEVQAVVKEFVSILPFDDQSQLALQKQLKEKSSADEIIEELQLLTHRIYDQREKDFGADVIRQLERYVVMSTMDEYWMNHLDNMDNLREGIWLRGDKQAVLSAYKQEAFQMFETLMGAIDDAVSHRIFRLQPQLAQQQSNQVRPAIEVKQEALSQSLTEQKNADQRSSKGPQQTKGSLSDLAEALAGVKAPAQVAKPGLSKVKIGRNEPCPCGSGKKYKQCHGKLN